MVFGAVSPKVSTVIAGLVLNPVIQGQRRVDGEVDRVNRPVRKPILVEISSMCSPYGKKPPYRGPLSSVLIDEAVFSYGRTR